MREPSPGSSAREAKSAHERWIESYRVVIAEVLTTYGRPGLGLEHAPVAG